MSTMYDLNKLEKTDPTAKSATNIAVAFIHHDDDYHRDIWRGAAYLNRTGHGDATYGGHYASGTTWWNLHGDFEGGSISVTKHALDTLDKFAGVDEAVVRLGVGWEWGVKIIKEWVETRIGGVIGGNGKEGFSTMMEQVSRPVHYKICYEISTTPGKVVDNGDGTVTIWCPKDDSGVYDPEYNVILARWSEEHDCYKEVQ